MTAPLRSIAVLLLLMLGSITLIGCTPDRSSYYGDFHPLEVMPASVVAAEIARSARLIAQHREYLLR